MGSLAEMAHLVYQDLKESRQDMGSKVSEVEMVILVWQALQESEDPQEHPGSAAQGPLERRGALAAQECREDLDNQVPKVNLVKV